MIPVKDQISETFNFSLTFEQLQKAHEIYQKHCFFLNFIGFCEERHQNEIGLCNLPYKTLEHESELLRTAYEFYVKIKDCNIAYNDTLNSVVDEIEKQIADGKLIYHTQAIPHTSQKLFILHGYTDGLTDPVVSKNYEDVYTAMKAAYESTLNGITQNKSDQEYSYLEGWSAVAVIQGNWFEWRITELNVPEIM